jgi:diguanylate cyclase (GGDEF)-like protein
MNTPAFINVSTFATTQWLKIVRFINWQCFNKNMAEDKSAVELHEMFQHALRLIYQELDLAEQGLLVLPNAEEIAKRISAIRSSSSTLEEIADGLLFKATTDGLTQLKNRAHFEEWIKKKIDKVPDLGCLMTDLDQFGRYNNTYGHQQGDVALKTVAEIVRKTANSEYVARYGGEEFSIILAGYNNSKHDIRKVAENIRKAVETRFVPAFDIEAIVELCKDATNNRRCKKEIRQLLSAPYETREEYLLRAAELIRDLRVRRFVQGIQNVTVSIGVAIRKPDETTNHLIYRADKALYASKEAGRNCVTLAR